MHEAETSISSYERREGIHLISICEDPLLIREDSDRPQRSLERLHEVSDVIPFLLGDSREADP